jgi:hypothetical protein
VSALSPSDEKLEFCRTRYKYLGYSSLRYCRVLSFKSRPHSKLIFQMKRFLIHSEIIRNRSIACKGLNSSSCGLKRFFSTNSASLNEHEQPPTKKVLIYEAKYGKKMVMLRRVSLFSSFLTIPLIVRPFCLSVIVDLLSIFLIFTISSLRFLLNFILRGLLLFWILMPSLSQLS